MSTVSIPGFKEQLLVAGCDEVGRGCLAGPVVAAAVMLPFDFPFLLKVSVLLTKKIFCIIKEKP